MHLINPMKTLIITMARALHRYQLNSKIQRKADRSIATHMPWKFRCAHFKDNGPEQALRYPSGVLPQGRENWLRELANITRFPAVVSAGHYMPDLADFDAYPEDAAKSLEFGMSVFEILRKMGKTEFLLYLNDIHAPALPKNSLMQNPHRERLYSPYVPPEEVRKVMEIHRIKEIIYEGEKNHYNAFVSKCRKKNRAGSDTITKLLGEDGGEYSIGLPTRDVQLFGASDSKCIGACAYLFNLLVENGFKTCVFAYPNCSKGNLEAAIETASLVFGLDFKGENPDLEIWLMYLNHACF